MKRCRRNVASKSGSYCTSKNVAGCSDDREADSASSALVGPVVINDGVQILVLSRRMEVDEGRRCNFVNS